jgi:hypothetical protein
MFGKGVSISRRPALGSVGPDDTIATDDRLLAKLISRHGEPEQLTLW